MFEYLMPLLVMPTYENTLLDQTYRAAVERQIEYGRQRGVPWGMSESGYNSVDVHLNYQYRAFGVPGLGLKRGLGEDLVVAPYASALALMIAPEAACLNLQRLSISGLAGNLGLFEAIDYTPSRLRRGEPSAVVQSFMAHHQAMSLLSFAYVLLGRPMQKRFESDPLFQATLLLLQERIPRGTLFHSNATDVSDIRVAGSGTALPVRVLTSPDTAIPEVQLLSNGRYHVMVTNAGGGSSRWKDLAVTRWREDDTADNWGTFCYLARRVSGEFWSLRISPRSNGGALRGDLLGRTRGVPTQDFDFETHTEIVVSPEDDIEVRRVHITNRSRSPGSSKSRVTRKWFSRRRRRTRCIPRSAISSCKLRSSGTGTLSFARAAPRSLEEQVPWMFHLTTVHGARPRDLVRNGPAAFHRPRWVAGRAACMINPERCRTLQVPYWIHSWRFVID
jgi:hypothetical protein